jgi:hypothetical protein
MCRSFLLHTVPEANEAVSTGFVRTKNYDNLAGVLLAITGCEAML